MIDQSPYTLDCFSDVVRGDEILFLEDHTSKDESVPGPIYQGPVPYGKRLVAAKVVSESYGHDKQQHTFTLQVCDCEGEHRLPLGIRIYRKGRFLYLYGVKRKPWKDEKDREREQENKHMRGMMAKTRRNIRKQAGG